MTGTIGVTDLKVWCILGVMDEEREKEQLVHFDLELSYDMAKAAEIDDIRDALDYRRVVDLIADHSRYQKYQLLEALVSGVVHLLRTAYPFVAAGRVRAAKDRPLGDRCEQTWAELQW